MKLFLETERLILRQFTEVDGDHLFELDSDPEVVRFTPQADRLPDYDVIQSQTLPGFLAYYERYKSYGYWAVIEKKSQVFVGWFFFRPAIEAPYFNPALTDPMDIELGYRLRKAVWGQGYATEVAKALIQKGFFELGTQRVIAPVLAANLASIRVLEKAGLSLQTRFFYEALGQEVAVYALDRDQFKQESDVKSS